MRIKFDYGKEVVPIDVIASILDMFKNTSGITATNMDIYVRFRDSEGLICDPCMISKDGSTELYTLIVSPNELKKYPMHTRKLKHITLTDEDSKIKNEYYLYYVGDNVFEKPE